MHEDWNNAAIYVVPFSGHLAFALVVLLSLRLLLARLRFGDFVTNAPLAKAGIYV